MLSIPFGFFNQSEENEENPFRLAFAFNNDEETEVSGLYTQQGNGEYEHVAVVRNGNTISLYQNGVEIGNTNYSGSINFNSGIPLSIGSTNDGAEAFTVFMDEIRISKTARYTENFVPPASPFSSDGSTSLLLHFDSEDQFTFDPVIDSSSSAHTITTAGTGGSLNLYTDQSVNFGKFDRGYTFLNSQDSATPGTSSKYLTVASDSTFDFENGNFTIEAWISSTFGISRVNPMQIISRYTKASSFDWYFCIKNA